MSAPEDHNGFLPDYGNYENLLSFQKAEVVYDLTFRFAHKYLSKGDRTIDQMIQSARSGKKNLLEGSKASKTSSEMELKLTNVARASLEELLDDYKDYLRARDLRLWDKDSKEAQQTVREGLPREWRPARAHDPRPASSKGPAAAPSAAASARAAPRRWERIGRMSLISLMGPMGLIPGGQLLSSIGQRLFRRVM